MTFRLRPPDLLIAGASARAAAFSAVRAGLTVAAADLFADRDLAAIADAAAIRDWPNEIESWAAQFPPSVPLIYVGGLENEPKLLDRLAATRPLIGITGEPLRQARTPEILARLVNEAGLATPRIATSADPGSARWLVKPRRSAAGRGIRMWTGEPLAAGEYLQEFIAGRPGSAAYLAAHGTIELLGVTELLLPDSPPLSIDAPFTYVGSITTDDVPLEALERLGRRLATAGLTGLFGVDFVRTEVAGATAIVPIEVNPRYTAGMEVLELRSRRSFVAENVVRLSEGDVAARSDRVAGDDAASTLGAESARSRRPQSNVDSVVRLSEADRPPRRGGPRCHACHGKRIVYAPRPLRVGTLPVPTRVDIIAGAALEIADIPASGTFVAAGAPICTVFAAASSRDAVHDLLKERERHVLAGCESA